MTEFNQNLMIDKELIKRIVKYAKLTKKDVVLEIGAGTGNLTQELAKKSKVVAIEIDDNSLKILQEKKLKNVEIIKTNALDLDVEYDKIVSNLPYNICEPLFNRLIKKDFKLGIFTVPRKFAERLTEEKSLLSLTIPLFFKIEILEIVQPVSFEPQPNIESAVIKITPRKRFAKKEKLLKNIYLQQDKKLGNAIRESYRTLEKLTKWEAAQKIPKLPFIEKYVNQLSYEDWKILLENI